MLIRSQNGEYLLPLHAIYIESKRLLMSSIDPSVSSWLLGIYDSKERCFEVLDEIQQKYSSYLYTKGGIMPTLPGDYINPFAFIPPKVYQMPEK